MEEMYRVIKWVKDRPNVGMKIRRKIEKHEERKIVWKMSGISDSTWGSNKEDGRSLTGCVPCFMGVSVAWKSKSQPNATLSSSEAECIAISELAKEALFAPQILEDVCIRVEPLVKVFVDNVGVINMVRNDAVCNGTGHVNVRCHFVRDLHEKA